MYVFELLAAITGLWYFRKVRNTHWVFFTFYLVFIAVAETTGQFIRKTNPTHSNLQFFNYFVIPVEFLFNFWLFYFSFVKSKLRKLPVFFMVMYILCWLFDIIYLSHQRFFFHSFSYTIGNLLLLILILRFFYQLITSNEIILFRQNMQFWISLGLLIFYLGSFPYYGLLNTMAYSYPHLANIYTIIVYVLNCLMYLMFTFSFIWGKPNLKSSSY